MSKKRPSVLSTETKKQTNKLFVKAMKERFAPDEKQLRYSIYVDFEVRAQASDLLTAFEIAEYYSNFTDNIQIHLSIYQTFTYYPYVSPQKSKSRPIQSLDLD